jgi:ThiF family
LASDKASKVFLCVGKTQNKQKKSEQKVPTQNVRVDQYSGKCASTFNDVNFIVKADLITHLMRLVFDLAYKKPRPPWNSVYFSFKASAMRDVKSGSKNGDIDESLYSRQLYVLGVDAMLKMQNSDVLISGIGGLGVEIAKNLILGGVKSVTLHDQTTCTIRDLSSQFYLNKSSVGQNRAECCAKQLLELNNYVTTSVYTGELTDVFLSKFKVVVLTETTDKEQKRIAEICRSNRTALITADTKGLFGQIFW